MSLKITMLTALLALTACQQSSPEPEGNGDEAPSGTWRARAHAGEPIWATFETTEGDIVVELFSSDAPKTVQNFVGLAAGEKEWTDPRTGEKTSRPLYAGTKFHRVIDEFMIQGGDPLGTGHGGPGYQFEDEFQSGRGFDEVGLLAMANAGPNTNGSQFFITVSEPSWLNGKHTIFGKVVSGYDVVERIAKVPTASMNRPTTDVVINAVTLSQEAPTEATGTSAAGTGGDEAAPAGAQ